MSEFRWHAEQQAEAATKLRSFPINLGEIRRTVTHILSQFGRGLMFEEYTVHDISHIDDMLNMLSWLIPESTQAQLTKAEWLMIVLSAYFHDMGLIVTEEEYNNRAMSGFENFCEGALFAAPGGQDYKNKISILAEDKRNRFLYQEFVRANHGRRVR